MYCLTHFMSLVSFHTSCKNQETCRSSRPEGLCKKGVLRNFAKFTGKHMCFCNFVKKEALAHEISCELCEISKNGFFYRAPLGDCFYRFSDVFRGYKKITVT